MVRDTKGVHSFYNAVGTPTNDFWRHEFQISDNNRRVSSRAVLSSARRREREEEGKEEEDKKNARTASAQRINIVNFF